MDSYAMDNNNQELTIDIKKYLYLLWHWAWLIILVTIVASLAAYLVSVRMTPVFEASTTILVDVPSYNTTEYTALMASEQLSQTYSEMMTSNDILTQVKERLGLQIDLEELRGMISVQSITNTQLIEISVECIDPNAAALIANNIVEVFSAEIKEIQSSRYNLSKSSLESQMTEVEEEIASLNNKLQSDITEAERDRYETKLAQYQQIYSTLLSSYEEIRLSEAQTMTSLVLIEPATVPDEPIKPRVLMNTAIAGLTGFLLATGAIFAGEALDDRLKTPDDIKNYLGLPILGIIDSFPQDDGNDLIAAKHPRSPITEEFRTLRTNVQFASVDKALNSILVTSSEPREGKTAIAVNLGVVFAQSGLKTTMIDCDMRRPAVHARFGLNNNSGLTSFFYRSHSSNIEEYYKKPFTNLNLQILTSGSIPPNPSELLTSNRMKGILGQIKKDSEIVIIDSPPVLVVTDAVILSPQVDGVLLVVQPGKTKIPAAKETVDQLKRAKANILGVVIKFVEGKRNRGTGRYGYYTRSKYDSYYRADEISDEDADFGGQGNAIKTKK